MLASVGEMEAVAGGEGGVESEGGAGWAISCFCSSAGEPGETREERKKRGGLIASPCAPAARCSCHCHVRPW